jgi:hypothetical protein
LALVIDGMMGVMIVVNAEIVDHELYFGIGIDFQDPELLQIVG